MNPKSAISAIDQAGALLVFPIDNRKLPASLWAHFHPRKPMLWEWDESGDSGVADLWNLRSELSTTRKVVYTKWFRGRATYFSKPLFTAMLSALNGADPASRAGLSPAALRILGILDAESPLSTKELKRQADLKGRANEAAYERALKELWSRLQIVAFGEVDDGAFPSLAVGSTRVLFETLWQEASAMRMEEAELRIAEILAPGNLFRKHYSKLKAALPVRASAAAAGPRARAVPREVRFDEI